MIYYQKSQQKFGTETNYYLTPLTVLSTKYSID